jgi:hypothetical protein
MGRTACTVPQCLYKGALYLTLSLLSESKMLKLSWVARKRFREHWLSWYRYYAADRMSENLPFDFRQGQEVFLFSKSLRLVREPNSEFFSIDKCAISLGLNLPRRATDHSSPQSAEVKNVWSYISISATWLYVVHRDNFK